jgi:isochorismate hydrolase
MLKRFSEQELLGKPLTEQQKRELLALMEMPEENIDTSDIPEVRDLPPDAVRGDFFHGRTVALSEDLHAYFSAIAARKGVSLNDLINDILAKDIAIVETVR